MKHKPKLEPCPFCGGGANAGAWRYIGGWAVVCDRVRCQASGPLRSTQALAVRAWNGRPKARRAKR